MLDTLAALAERGIGERVVASTLNRVEFRHREIRGNGSPYALRLMRRVLRGWSYGADPVDSLEFAPVMASLKRRLAADGRFFERLVSDRLLGNLHRVTLVVRPDPAQEDRDAADERGRIDAVHATDVRRGPGPPGRGADRLRSVPVPGRDDRGARDHPRHRPHRPAPRARSDSLERGTPRERSSDPEARPLHERDRLRRPLLQHRRAHGTADPARAPPGQGGLRVRTPGRGLRCHGARAVPAHRGIHGRARRRGHGRGPGQRLGAPLPAYAGAATDAVRGARPRGRPRRGSRFPRPGAPARPRARAAERPQGGAASGGHPVRRPAGRKPRVGGDGCRGALARHQPARVPAWAGGRHRRPARVPRGRAGGAARGPDQPGHRAVQPDRRSRRVRGGGALPRGGTRGTARFQRADPNGERRRLRRSHGCERSRSRRERPWGTRRAWCRDSPGRTGAAPMPPSSATS